MAQVTNRKRPVNRRDNPRVLKRKRIVEDLETLQKRVQDLDVNPTDQYQNFSQLPLSDPTVSGLKASHFKTLTDIQARAIPLALQGRDILGAAKTGSGKTLSFLIPVLERLYYKRWTKYDGLGALVISPTRELAIQIFEVLRKIGRYHDFSAGLVIGGKNLKEEKEAIGKMNILVCTPGRILQHLDQSSAMETDYLQMLVLDEADRIMDMGFQGTVDAIVNHLPKDRQTLLFSATQTKKVSDLARLSLENPEYVAVHEKSDTATPATLKQNYVVTPLPQKLDTLWSFLRANVKSKIMVFVSSGKQVRFIYESFRHMQPGIPLLHLHGRQKQTARLSITTRFSNAKYCCLFATDVVARGLDFPAVDWVIQLDCPEDADTYIHRVGRTARFEHNGRAVLFLDPSEEEGMIKRLEQKKVPIQLINVKQNKRQSIQNQLQNMCFKDPELKYLGQKAFTSYTRSIHLQKDKEVFHLEKLPLAEFAASLGLPGAPKVRFTSGEDVKKLKNAPRYLLSSDEESGEDNGDASADETEDAVKKRKTVKDTPRTKYDRMFERRNQDVLADHYRNMIDDGDSNASLDHDADSDDDFLSVKQRFEAGDETLGQGFGDAIAADAETRSESESKSEPLQVIPVVGKAPLVIDSNRRQKLLQSKKKLLKFKGNGKKIVFDEEGNAHDLYEFENEQDFRARGKAEDQIQRFLETEKAKVAQHDVRDKEVVKEKRKAKKEKAKAKERQRSQRDDEGGAVLLAPYEPDAQLSDAESSQDSAEPERQQHLQTHDYDDYDEKRPGNLEELEAIATGLLG